MRILLQLMRGAGDRARIAFVILLLSSLSLAAYAMEVSGEVTDELGEPIIGATVIVDGTQQGIITDIDGKFSFVVKDVEKPVLKVSCVGMTTQRVPVTKDYLNIQLTEEQLEIEEVVVVGYATTKKKEVSGAISNLGSEVIAKTQAESFQKAIQGRMSGVQVISTSGTPGGAVSIQVRGKSTIGAGSEPLYIIDGVQITAGDQSSGILKSTDILSTLNPDEIESIDVLKDGATASIYGAQAANGVVIITTKKGREGKTKVTAKVSGGFQNVANLLPVLNGPQYAEMALLASKNLNGERSIAYNKLLENFIDKGWGENGYSNAPTTNWYDEVYRTAWVQDYQLGISGGGKKTRFYIGAGYNETEGIVKNTGFNRINLRTNLSHDITSWVTVNTNTSFSNMDQAQYSRVKNSNPMRAASLIQPTNSPYDEEGNYLTSLTDGEFIHNVAQTLELNHYDGRTMKFITANSLDFKLFKGLTFKSSYNYDLTELKEHSFIDPRTRAGEKDNGIISMVNTTIQNFQTEQVFNYNTVIGEKHRLSATAGFSYRHQQRTGLGASASGVAHPNFTLLGSAAIPLEADEPFSEWKMAGFFGRANYIFNDRYIVTGTLRYDGSSRFGSDQKWGLFPSLSAAWRMNEEEWIKPIEWISDLRLRAGYGITGNSNIGNYEAQRLYAGLGAYDNKPGIYPNTIGNPALTWEKNHSKNFGVSFGVLDNRISLESDFYLNDTKDLLYYRQIPSTTGYSVIPSNMGGVRNMGVDLMLNTLNVSFDGFEWRTTINFSYNKNEITALQDGLEIIDNYKVGESVSSERTYAWAGVNSADGRPMYYDKDGYITYRPTLEDRVWTGTKDPKYYGGVSNDFSYKGISLSVFFQYQAGANAYWSDKSVLMGWWGDANMPLEMYEQYWRKPGDQTWVPRPITQEQYVGSPRKTTEISTLHFEQTDYLKLKNINLSYDLPKSLIKRWQLSGLQIFASAYNLLTWTNYPGNDPEFVGDDQGLYPASRSFSFGVKLEL